MHSNNDLTYLADWYHSPLGEALKKAEKKELDAVLPQFYGFHLLQLGITEQGHWLEKSIIPHRINLNPHKPDNSRLSFCYGNFDALPFANDSIDAVVLPHLLEFMPNPKKIIQDVWRILIAEGHIVILCFNRCSMMGIRRLFHFNSNPPWSGVFFKRSIINKWLRELGCEFVQTKTFFFLPPFKAIAKLDFLEAFGKKIWPGCGGVFMIVAKKKLTTLTPVKPRWSKPEVAIAKGFEPTARG